LKNHRIIIIATALSILIHVFFIRIDTDFFHDSGTNGIEIPVTLVPLAEKKPKNISKKIKPRKEIPSDVKQGKGLYTAGYKNTLIKKYLFFLREEIERHKYTPAESKFYGLIGNLKIAFDIGPGGRFSNIRIVRSSGDELLDKTAVRAVHYTDGKYKRPAWSGHKRLRIAFILKYQYGL